jgi:AraC-like DNA-binding protein
MYVIIDDMDRTSFQGHLKGLYLEAKVVELFLLQIEQLDQSGYATQAKLKKHDVERLYEIKQYLELNFDQPTSIAELSRRAGINQMKLKAGFKQLFNTTVFGYIHLIRMEEAKRLLLEENMYVNEVAYSIGYKHPHHFTAAFKKQFNITPGQLRK